VKVIELAPPAVQTDLHDYMGPHGKNIGIPLAEFMVEAMAGLDRGDDEFGIGHAATSLKAAQATFGATFEAMNAADV
jgi:short-subunit dehydrogenase involved in D-alanine esterification of teichoic acids